MFLTTSLSVLSVSQWPHPAFTFFSLLVLQCLYQKVSYSKTSTILFHCGSHGNLDSSCNIIILSKCLLKISASSNKEFIFLISFSVSKMRRYEHFHRVSIRSIWHAYYLLETHAVDLKRLLWWIIYLVWNCIFVKILKISNHYISGNKQNI